MLILADTPRVKAAEVFRCDEKSLAAILDYWVDNAMKSRPLDDVERFAIDEISRREKTQPAQEKLSDRWEQPGIDKSKGSYDARTDDRSLPFAASSKNFFK